MKTDQDHLLPEAWVGPLETHLQAKHPDKTVLAESETHVFGLPRLDPLNRHSPKHSRYECEFQMRLGLLYRQAYPHLFERFDLCLDAFRQKGCHLNHVGVQEALFKMIDQGKITHGIFGNVPSLQQWTQWWLRLYHGEQQQEEEDDDTYYILTALVYRVGLTSLIMQDIIEQATINAKHHNDEGVWHPRDARLILSLQLHIDSHWSICAYMRRHADQIATDQFLGDHSYNKESLWLSAIEQCAPGVYAKVTSASGRYAQDGHYLPQVVYAGFLPNLTPYLEQADLWHSSRTQYLDLIRAMVHVFFTKSQPHKGANRNFAQILQSYSIAFPLILRLFRMMMACSMLGNYPRAQFRPPFEMRVMLYEEFHGAFGALFFSNTVLINWVTQNDDWSLFIAREMTFHMIDYNIPLSMVIRAYSHWDKLRTILTRTNDYWRSFLGTLLFKQFMDPEIATVVKAHINETLQHHHELSVAGDIKLYKGSFEDVLLGIMDKHRNNKLPDSKIQQELREHPTLREHVTRIAQIEMKKQAVDNERWCYYMYALPKEGGFDPSDVNLNELQSAKTELQLVDAFMRDQRRAIQPIYQLSLGWLQYLGVSDTACKSLRKQMFMYYNTRITDNYLTHMMNYIRGLSERDFLIIYYYICSIHQAQIFYGTYPLTRRNAENQYKALRHKMNCRMHEEVPDTATNIWFCSVCHRWSVPEVSLLEPNTWRNIYAINMSYMRYDPTTEKLYCNKKVVADNEEDQANVNNYLMRSSSSMSTTKRKRRHKANRSGRGGGGGGPMAAKSEGYVNSNGRRPRHNIMTLRAKQMIKSGKTRRETMMLSRKPLSDQVGRSQNVDCYSVPLKREQMLGQVHGLGGQRWFLCEICGSMAVLDNYCMDSSGRLVCGIHTLDMDVPPIDTIEHVLMQLPRTKEHIKCIACNARHRSTFATADNMAMVSDVKADETLTGSVVPLYVLDDSPGNWKRRLVWLCQRDYNQVTSYTKTTALPLLSDITRHADSRTKNQGQRHSMQHLGASVDTTQTKPNYQN